MKFLKRHAYALLFTLFLMGANVYSLLKVFVIPSAVSTVSANTTSSSTSSSTASTSTGKVTKTDTTYKDDNMDIKITTGKTSDTTYYVADIQLSSADYLKTALAQNTYGTNITDTTSSIAQQNNAIFAINGDYYGANQSGYVIKNGQVYRDTDRNSDYEDLAVYSDGSFKTFKESDTTAQKLVDSGVVNTFAFGQPWLKMARYLYQKMKRLVKPWLTIHVQPSELSKRVTAVCTILSLSLMVVPVSRQD